jgi:PAS domain S-box-containing protein
VKSPPSRQGLQRQVAELTARLREAEEALAAIREGDVDAIFVSGKRGTLVFSLAGADSVYRLIVESMQEAALTATREGRILFCNRQFSTMLKLPQDVLLGRNLADLVAEEDHAILASLLQAAESKPAKGRLHFHGLTGSIPSLASASFLPQQEVPTICIVAADLTDLEASHDRLRQSNEELQRRAVQLRRLAGELAQTEDRERRRLASILHDGLQQLLVGAQLQMGKVITESGKRPGPTSRRVAQLLDQAIELSRSLALEISPPFRFGSGLVAAFTWLARSMAAKHSLQVAVKAKGEIGPAGEEISSLLFRSVQELLLNVVKHAGVRTADLRVEVNRDNLHISVADKGRGFDVDSVERAPGDSGFGLFSIRERLGLLGGRMEVRSAPGTGSSFTLVVPLASLRPDAGKTAAMTGGPSRRRSPAARRRPGRG